MLLLDDNNNDIARKYKATFDDENREYAISKLKELLSRPVVVSKEIKNSVATNLLKPTKLFGKFEENFSNKRLIEVTTNNIIQISDYVRIATETTTIKTYDFPFALGFIAESLPNVDKVINELDYASAKYLDFLLKSFSFDELYLLLYSCCDVKSFDELHKLIINNQKTLLNIAEIKLFKDLFSHVTLTEITSWMAPFSIREEEVKSWRYEEAEREVIDNSVETAKCSGLIYKTLSLRPIKKNPINY